VAGFPVMHAKLSASLSLALLVDAACAMVPIPELPSSWPDAVCPGELEVGGLGSIQAVPMWWDNVSLPSSDAIVTKIGGRAYWANACTPGLYDQNQYLGLNLLGSTLRYKTDISGAGCGCNAALYLTAMRQNSQPTPCKDYYCDANSVCGVACTEIDIQEANMHAWHSTLHSFKDAEGYGKGYGGGGRNWTGPRQWSSDEYGPGAPCIDTNWPFEVAVSFPLTDEGRLAAVKVTLVQTPWMESPCHLRLALDNYTHDGRDAFGELTEALAAGMTPVVSYWESKEMLWMDGDGKDHSGPCQADLEKPCAESVKFYDFKLEKLAPDEVLYVPPEPKAEPKDAWAAGQPRSYSWLPQSEAAAADAVLKAATEKAATEKAAADKAAADKAAAERAAAEKAAAERAAAERAAAESAAAAKEQEARQFIADTSECKKNYVFGCSWTRDYSCPGQAWGRYGLAHDEGSRGYRCCCKLGLWREDPGEESDLHTEESDLHTEVHTDLEPRADGQHTEAKAWEQCGGTVHGSPWSGPTSCPEGYVCKSWQAAYSQCVQEDSEMIIRKDLLFPPVPARSAGSGLALAGLIAVPAALGLRALVQRRQRPGMADDYTGLDPHSSEAFVDTVC